MKIAVIGLGRVGWAYHIPTILKNPKFTLCAVVDNNADRLLEAKEKYGVEGYTDISVMIEKAKPDAVVICTPTHLHRAHAVLAMEAGVDVFLDKPMAKDLEECIAIRDCMVRTGRKLMVYQPHRLLPDAVALRAVLQEDLIGRVYMFKRTVSAYARRNDWQAMLKFGGGMLNNYGAHYIDQALFLLGSDEEIEKMDCIRYRMASLGDADDVVKILLLTKSHITIDIDINQATALALPPFAVYGKYGSISRVKLQDGTPAFRVQYLVPEELSAVSLSEELAAADRKYAPERSADLPWHTKDFPINDFPPVDYYDAFYEYVVEDKPSFVPVEQTIKLMDIINTCKENSVIFE